MSERWSVTHASDREAALALKRLRGNWGSKAKDHMMVEAVRVLILVAVFLLAVADVISPQSFLAFLLGYLGFTVFFRWARPRLLLRFGPKEFAQKGGGTVTISESGIRTESAETLLSLAWTRVPQPTVYKDGLVFRLAHEVAVPFPTNALGNSATEIAAAIQRWKAGAEL